jgi:hypothetical protein
MMKVSPVPAHTSLGAVGANVSEPMDWASMSSKVGRQLAPPSSVFHTPPEAAPTHQVSGSPGMLSAAMARFPSGPTWRKR